MRRINERYVQTKKKKQTSRPYDKWVTIRNKIRDADVRHMVLINKITDFLRNVLPDTTSQQNDMGTQAPIDARDIGPQHLAIGRQTEQKNYSFNFVYK